VGKGRPVSQALADITDAQVEDARRQRPQHPLIELKPLGSGSNLLNIGAPGTI
jgi:hypothetical protein